MSIALCQYKILSVQKNININMTSQNNITDLKKNMEWFESSNLKNKKIALLYSGGADSTLIYYKLLQCIDSTTSLTLVLFDRFNNPVEKATKLYDNLKERWNDKNSTLEILDVADYAYENRMQYAISTLNKRFDSVVLGFNKYPSDESIRPKSVLYTMTNLNRALETYSNLVVPLSNTEKDEVIKTFYDNNIEDVLPLTHSCGSGQSYPCGECFNCKERIWAYKKLGLILDMGI